MKELADKIRKLVDEHTELTLTLERTLRFARESGLEVELLDGVNTEVAHDLDGLTAFRLRVAKITAKMPL